MKLFEITTSMSLGRGMHASDVWLHRAKIEVLNDRKGLFLTPYHRYSIFPDGFQYLEFFATKIDFIPF